MRAFRLIQRGTFNSSGKTIRGGCDGVISFHYMGAAEYEFGAVPRSYNRILKNYEDYGYFHSGIATPDGEELIIFCNKHNERKIVSAVQNFVNKPYELKRGSELEKVPQTECRYPRRSNFWWCIDDNSVYGDWMAFLQSKTDLFCNAIRNDYISLENT